MALTPVTTPKGWVIHWNVSSARTSYLEVRVRTSRRGKALTPPLPPLSDESPDFIKSSHGAEIRDSTVPGRINTLFSVETILHPLIPSSIISVPRRTLRFRTSYLIISFLSSRTWRVTVIWIRESSPFPVLVPRVQQLKKLLAVHLPSAGAGAGNPSFE